MVAGSVLESINKPIEADDATFDISASIGISIYPEDGTDAAQLRRLADAAMYPAKQAGGGQLLMVASHSTGTADEVTELGRFMRTPPHDKSRELFCEPQSPMAR